MEPKHLGKRAALACIVATAAPAALPAGASAAGEPILGLEQVRPGMACTARSVLRGTAIERFDARVVDVVSGSVTGRGPRILLRLSGPAIEETGVGPGFSGSPISCAGADGVERVIGAISEGIGEATNHLVLATPIEAILSESVSEPARASRAGLGPIRRLSGAWAVSGAPAWLANDVQAGAQRAGVTIFSAPTAPLAAFAPVDLQPGGAMAAALATGDLNISAVGTVAYRDGDRVWGFGHPLDGVGARSLPMQDAYVYGIVNLPGFAGGSYKLAAPGHVVGALRQDGQAAVGGVLGQLPRTIPLTVTARDGDRGTAQQLRVNVADETHLDDPAGMSPLRLVSSIATAQAAGSALGGAPTRQTARLCLRITLDRVPAPLGFCAGTVTEGAMPGILASQVEAAFAEIEASTFARPRVRAVSVEMALYRGMRKATLIDATGPRRVRPGQRVDIRAIVQEFRGRRIALPLHVRVPRSQRAGRVTIRLTGTTAAPDAPPESFADLVKAALTEPESEGKPAASVSELARRIAAMGSDSGITARVGRGRPARVYRSPRLQIDGRTRLSLAIATR